MLIAARFSGSGSGKDLLSRAISLIASGLLPFSSFPIPVAPDSRTGVARRSGWENSDNQDGNPASRHWHDRRGVSVAQGAIEGLIVAARRSGVGRDCRVDGRAASAPLAFERSAAAVAFDIPLADG